MRVKIVKTESAMGRATLGCQASTQTVSALLLAAAALLAACSRESSDTLASSDSTACDIANADRNTEARQSFDTSGFLSRANFPELSRYLEEGTVSPGSGSCPSGQWGFNSLAQKTCCSQTPSASEASTGTDSTPPSTEGVVTALLGFGGGGGCLSRSQIGDVLQTARERGYQMDRQLSSFTSRTPGASRSAIPCGGTSRTSQAAAAASAANAAEIERSRQRAATEEANTGTATPPAVAPLPSIPSFMDKQLTAPTTTTAGSSTSSVCTKSSSGRTETCSPAGLPGNTNFGPSSSMGLTAPQP